MQSPCPAGMAAVPRCCVPDAVSPADEPALHFEADDAGWSYQHEIDLCPRLGMVDREAEGMQGGPVGGESVADVREHRVLSRAARVLADGGRQHPGHRIPQLSGVFCCRNPRPGAEGRPASSARSSSMFISSQLASGSSAQEWQAARLRPSTPLGPLSTHSGSAENQEFLVVSSWNDASSRRGSASAMTPPRLPAESEVAV